MLGGSNSKEHVVLQDHEWLREEERYLYTPPGTVKTGSHEEVVKLEGQSQ
jgi:hypothetical protein